jgi:hypothetical protein
VEWAATAALLAPLLAHVLSPFVHEPILFMLRVASLMPPGV